MTIFATDPKPEVNKNSVSPARSLRVYESSIPGALSFYLPGDEHGMGCGLRLDRDQVAELHLALDSYLGETCS